MNFKLTITGYDPSPRSLPSSLPTNTPYVYTLSNNRRVFLSRPHTRPHPGTFPLHIQNSSLIYSFINL
jgi:hypothetical protein